MREFASLNEQQVCALLRTPADTLVLYHVRPDPDAIGSAFALARLLRALGSRAYCVCADEIPRRLRFLVDTQQESTLPESIPQGFCATRVITVDAASPSQLGALFDRFAEQITLMIDHHASGTVYADHYRVMTAATGELILDLFAALGVPVDPVSARLLYAAISGDTGCFKYSNTTPETHRRAAALLALGVDAAEINRLLFDCKPLSLLRAEKAAFDRLCLYREGEIAVVTFPYDLKEKMQLCDEDLETLIDVAREVAGVRVAVSIRQSKPEPVFRVSMRSACALDVAAVCAVFGGGGHVKAAGATIAAESIEAARDAVLAVLFEKFA